MVYKVQNEGKKCECMCACVWKKMVIHRRNAIEPTFIAAFCSAFAIFASFVASASA
jgi:hypothetical protein